RNGSRLSDLLATAIQSAGEMPCFPRAPGDRSEHERRAQEHQSARNQARSLVAGYQQGLPWMSKGGDTPLAAKIALWGGREIVGLLLVSLLAGISASAAACRGTRHRSGRRQASGAACERAGGLCHT